MRFAIPLFAAIIELAHGDGSCGGGDAGGAAPLPKEELFSVVVTSHFDRKISVFWEEHDAAIQKFVQYPDGAPAQLIAEFEPGQKFKFHVNSGFTFYAQEDGVRVSSITIIPGVKEYALEPGSFPVPPWGSLEDAAYSFFGMADEDKDEVLSWAEIGPLLNSERMKSHGVEQGEVLFERLDADGDHQLSWSEVKGLFRSIMATEEHGRARRASEEGRASGGPSREEAELEGFRHLLMSVGGSADAGRGGAGGCTQ